MRVILTGHNGFLGSAMSHCLHEHSELIGLGRPYTRRHPVNMCQEEKSLDLCDAPALKKAFDEIGTADVLIHSAAMISWDRADADRIHAVNVTLTRELAEHAVACGVQHLVFISAGARYGFSGEDKKPVSEAASFIPSESDPYARSKYEAEQALLPFTDRMRISVIYPSTVYGAGDMKMNSGTLIKMLSKRSFPVGFPGGTSWVSIRDFSEGVKRLVLNAPPREEGIDPYILSAENLTYRDLFRRIRLYFSENASAGLPVPIIFRGPALLAARILQVLPGFKNIGFFNVNIIEGFFRQRYFDHSRAEKRLDWAPTQTLEDAVNEAVAFYKDNDLWME